MGVWSVAMACDVAVLAEADIVESQVLTADNDDNFRRIGIIGLFRIEGVVGV